MKVLVQRIAMVGGGNAYNVLVPEAEAPAQYGSYVWMSGAVYLHFANATVSPEFLQMPAGWDRLCAWNNHERAAKQRMLEIIQSVFEETKNLETFPMLWVHFGGVTYPSEERIVEVNGVPD